MVEALSASKHSHAHTHMLYVYIYTLFHVRHCVRYNTASLLDAMLLPPPRTSVRVLAVYAYANTGVGINARELNTNVNTLSRTV